MTIEKGIIDLRELENIEVFGIPFGYKITANVGSNTNNLVIVPSPDRVEEFHAGLEYFDYETLILLRSKFYFGINHRTQMFEILYNTFAELYEKEQKDTNDFLTLQALYSDMIIKLGTILEDFAGMCYACKEYQLQGSDIAQVFLAYSDPISFYQSILEKKGKRKIKQIFSLPESKGDLNKIFKDLSDLERDLLFKAIQRSTDFIYDMFCDISTSIIRNTQEDVTYYDMYNKLKHGFSPLYPFVASMPVPMEGVPNEESIKETISGFFFENLIIMHDKLPGQRTSEEQEHYEKRRMATPTFTYQDIKLKTAEDMKRVVSNIGLIYRHLMKKYLLLSEGNNHVILLMSEDYLEDDERKKVESIINDRSRYINGSTEE